MKWYPCWSEMQQPTAYSFISLHGLSLLSLGGQLGQKGGLITAAEVMGVVAESQKDAMVLKHKMCLK